MNTAFAITLFLIAVVPLTGTVGLRLGAVAGAALALALWIFGQSFGELWTGSATDPNSGPLFVLLALALVERLSSAHTDQAVHPIDQDDQLHDRADATAGFGRQQAA